MDAIILVKFSLCIVGDAAEQSVLECLLYIKFKSVVNKGTSFS